MSGAPRQERTVVVLEEDNKQEIVAPLSSPFQSIAQAPIQTPVQEVQAQDEPFMKEVEFETTATAPIFTPNPAAAPEKTTFNLYDEPAIEPVSEVEAAQPAPAMTWDVFDVQTEETAPVQNPFVEAQVPQDAAPVVKHILEDEAIQKVNLEEPKRMLSPEEQMRKVQERVARIQEFTSKLKRPEGIIEFENEPAFVRRNIALQQTQPSATEQVSRFGITADTEGNSSLRNNSFLHDNVD
jgi:cell division protein FtsZ